MLPAEAFLIQPRASFHDLSRQLPSDNSFRYLRDLDQTLQIDSRRITALFEQEYEVLRTDVASCTGRERAAAEAADRRILATNAVSI